MDRVLIIFCLITFFILIIFNNDDKYLLICCYFTFLGFIFYFGEFLDSNYLMCVTLSIMFLAIFIIISLSSKKIIVLLLFLFFFSYSLLNVTDFLHAYVYIESLTICVFILIHYSNSSLLGVESCLTYLIVNLFSSSLLALGIWCLYTQWGVFDFETILYLQQYQIEVNLLDFTGVFLILVAFLIKISVVPFHNWMLEVYKGLKNESLLVITCYTKSILFIFLFNIFPILQKYSFIVILCASLSLLYGSFLLLFETNTYLYIGELSLVSSGYSLLFICFYQRWFLLLYIFTQSINLVFFICFLSNVQNIKDQINFFEYNTFISLSYFLVLISLIGIPPFITFLPKLILFNYLLSNYLLLFIVVVASLLNCIALLRICIYFFNSSNYSIIKNDENSYYFILSIFSIIFQLFFVFLTYNIYINV